MHTTVFPDPSKALSEPNGLLAVGGDLSVATLEQAYKKGIFPWFNQEPILWWSPDPRAILYPDKMHISRSLKKFIRHSDYKITLNTQFSAIISNCATARTEGTWINSKMQNAFTELHEQHHAHSVEVWQQEKLVGGLYGVGLGRVFCGESMFSLQDNASKCALLALCQHLLKYQFQVIDCQIINPHTASLGAIEVERNAYLTLLNRYQDSQPDPACWQQQELVITL